MALLAAVAVLVHHETFVTATHSIPAGAMSGMKRTATPGMGNTASAAQAVVLTRHDPVTQAAAPAMDHEGGGACSGRAVQHCGSGDVGASQVLTPPGAFAHATPGCSSPDVIVGHVRHAGAHRAPPDLSVLSRLLI
ncbi:hypothetical protein [Streptomyces longwoodensis]|uniref:hypothetical protein n=1 Tax=Streptomyces longwoodensis TaxID=68231 RepID=UPI0033CF6725